MIEFSFGEIVLLRWSLHFWHFRIAFKVFDCMVLRPSYFFLLPTLLSVWSKLDRSVVGIMYLMESFKELGSFKDQIVIIILNFHRQRPVTDSSLQSLSLKAWERKFLERYSSLRHNKPSIKLTNVTFRLQRKLNCYHWQGNTRFLN